MSLCLTPRIDALSRALTGRDVPLFDADRADVRAAVAGRRVLMVGAAGSIGSATLLELLDADPEEVLVLDPSENNLAELVRAVRSAPRPTRARFRIEPLGYGSALAEALLAAEPPFDLVLSFAALKHVRSERDVYSLLRMLEVNLVDADRFLGVARAYGHGAGGVFMVSTDKAAEPVSLMGASKRAMEALLWAHTVPGAPRSLLDGGEAPPLARVTTARFANVAFSDGSLPWAFLQRLEKAQPLASPEHIRRYFVSPREAGRLCLLAATACPHRHALVPVLDPERDTRTFVDVARLTLESFGLAPAYYRSEAEARAAVATDRPAGRYPVLLTSADTSGEKDVEIFVGEGEEARDPGIPNTLAVPGAPEDPAPLAALLRLVAAAARDPRALPDAGAVVAALARVVPRLIHKDTGRSLDDRM